MTGSTAQLVLSVLSCSLLGLAAGSFTATAALRFARGEPFLLGRSHCDGCGKALSFADTAPLTAYIARRGSARCCATQIHPLHPIGEAIGLVIGLVASLAAPLVMYAPLIVMGLSLMALAMVDWLTGRLPNPLVALVGIAGAVLSFANGSNRLLEGLLASLVTFIALEGLRRGFLHFRGRGGLGGGDVKLLSALALWLGLWTPNALLAASVLGLLQIALFKSQNGTIAFGPAICIAAFSAGVTRLVGFGL